MSFRFTALRPIAVATFAALHVVLGSACANVRVRSADDLKTAEGVVYYLPKPYLAVSQALSEDGNPTSLDYKILYLPDLDNARTVTWSSGLFGSAQPKLGFTDGWMLSSLDANVESGTSSAITALAGAFGAGLIADEAALPPGLYPLRWVPKRWVKETEDEPAHFAAGYYEVVKDGSLTK